MSNVRIDPLDFEKDVAIGFSFPLSNKTGGGFTLNYDTLSQARDNIKNLLLTEKGERYMQPDFGTSLRKFIFEMNNEDIEEGIEMEIKKSVSFWLPYVTIDEIKFNRYENMVHLYIRFFLNGNDFDKESLTLSFNAKQI